MFEFAKLTLEALKSHLSKPACQIEKAVLDRLLETCLQVPLFTDRQKHVLVTLKLGSSYDKSIWHQRVPTSVKIISTS